jgi:putative transposase
MKGILRIEFEGALYHIISRGVGRAPTFLDEKDYTRFLGRLAAVVGDGGLTVYAWCLLVNHFHLLARTPKGGLSHWIRKVLGPYAQWFNARHERTGYLWQGRYKAILVENGSYLVDCSRYIHLNPCRSNRSGRDIGPEEYRWTSFHAYTGGLNPFGIVDTEPVLSFFADPGDGGRLDRYRNYVEDGLDRDNARLPDEERGGVVLGSAAFAREIGRIVSEKKRSLVLAGHTRAVQAASLAKPTLGRIAAVVDSELGRFPFRRRRRIKQFLMKRLTFQESRVIGEFLGLHRATVNRTVLQIEREAADNPELFELLGRLMEMLAGED